jgi:hypothetical protein
METTYIPCSINLETNLINLDNVLCCLRNREIQGSKSNE